MHGTLSLDDCCASPKSLIIFVCGAFTTENIKLWEILCEDNRFSRWSSVSIPYWNVFHSITPPLQKIRREVLSPRLLLINLKAEIWPASSCGCYPTVTQPRCGVNLSPEFCFLTSCYIA